MLRAYSTIDRTGGHTATRLAWSLCAIAVALTALSLLLFNLSLSHPGTPVYGPWLDNTVGALSYAPIGALIASRRPENPVGWHLCLYGLAIGWSFLSAEYAIYALLAHPGSLPAGQAAGRTNVTAAYTPVRMGVPTW